MSGKAVEDPIWDDRAVWNVWLSANWMPTVAAADEVHLFEALEDGGPATAEEFAERFGRKLRNGHHRACPRTSLPPVRAGSCPAPRHRAG